jgi:hypothetical protein
MRLDFSALEKEIAEKIETQRRRDQLYDAKALTHLQNTAAPFVNYIRRRLIQTAKIDNEPNKNHHNFTYTVFLLTASKGNVDTYNNVVNFGMLSEDDDEFVWFVNNEKVDNFETLVRYVLHDCIANGLFEMR